MLKHLFKRDSSTRPKEVIPTVNQQYVTIMKKVLADQTQFLDQWHEYITGTDTKSQILNMPANFKRSVKIIYNIHCDFYLELRTSLDTAEEEYSSSCAIKKLVCGFRGVVLSRAYREYFDELRQLVERMLRVRVEKTCLGSPDFEGYLAFTGAPRLTLSELEWNLDSAAKILKNGHLDLDTIIFARDFVVLAGIEALDPRDALLTKRQIYRHASPPLVLDISLEDFAKFATEFQKTLNGPLGKSRNYPIGQLIHTTMAFSLVLSLTLTYGRTQLLERVHHDYRFDTALKKGFDAFPVMARKMATFAKKLEKRMSTWNPEMVIGDLILEFLRDLGYRVAYFRYTDYAKEMTSFLYRNIDQKTFFRSFNLHFSKKMAKKIGNVDFVDCYLGPVNFWARMVKLLQTIQACTGPSHRDYQDLKKSVFIATVVHSLVTDAIDCKTEAPKPTISKRKKIDFYKVMCC